MRQRFTILPMASQGTLSPRRTSGFGRMARACMALALALAGGMAALPAAAAPASTDPLLRALAPTPAVTAGQSATQLPDGRWLLLGGGEATVSREARLLDPATGQATVLSAGLSVARSEHSATLLPDGRVLVLGGRNEAGLPVTVAERFDPATNRFQALGEVGVVARIGHSVTVLPDGRLLIAGGRDAKGRLLTLVEVLDPEQGQVSRFGAALGTARWHQVAALLPSQQVLLWGGEDGRDQPLANGERLDLLTSRTTPVSLAQATPLVQALTPPAAPAVLESQPAAEAANVPVSQRLMLRLSKRMAVASFNAETVTLLGPTGVVAVTPVALEGGLLLFVTPKQELMPASQYTLFVQGATDAAGQPLPFTAISFTTGALSAGPRGQAKTGWAVASATPVAASATAAPTAPATPAAGQGSAEPDERWLPDQRHYHGSWLSGRRVLARNTLPQQEALRQAIYGDMTARTLRPRDVAASKLKQFFNAPVAPAGATAVSGQVLKLNGYPLANVTLSLGGQSVRTDANGEFLLGGVPAGHQVLVIDGSSADHGNRQYGRYEYGIDIQANRLNALPFVVWMSALDPQGDAHLPSPTAKETVVTNPAIPGLELHLPAGTVIRDAAGKIVTEINLTAIPVDQPPFPLPREAPVPVYFTIQPGGAHLSGIDARSAKGAQLIYPNFTQQAPGERVDFWNYDPTGKGWYRYGQGTVTADGRQVRPDAGVVLYEFTGAMVSVPANAPTVGPCPVCPLDPNAPKQPTDFVQDPVSAGTGLFLHIRTDLSVPDVIPIEINRTYRQMDSRSRAFGRGTNLSYDMFIVGDTGPYTYVDLILPDGGRIRLPRISAGTSYLDAVYQAQSGPTRFFGAIMYRDISNLPHYWKLVLKDGTVYRFLEAAGSTNAREAAVSQVEDRNGNVVTLTRNSSFDLTKITSPNGRSISLVYDSSHRVTSATDDLGRVVQYAYDSQGRLVTVTNPLNQTETYTYDSNHNLLTVTDGRGNVMVSNVYDANNRVSQQTYADGTTSSFSYALDGSGKVTQTDVTDERGTVKRMSFDSSGFITSITEGYGTALAQTTTYARNAASQLQSVTDALGRVTAYQYDSLGNLVQNTALSGTGNAVTASRAFDANFAQPLVVTDALGHSTQYGYDSRGNLLSVTDALGHTVTYTRDPQGRVVKVKDALNQETTLAYSGADLSSLTDALGRTTRFYHDGAGRLRTVTDPLGRNTYYTYDALDRVTALTNPAGKTISFSYDANGNRLTQTDEAGNTTTFTYDALNRALSQVDALNRTTSFAYAASGQLSRRTDRKSQVTGLSYDDLGRLTQVGYGATPANPTSFVSTVANTWDTGNRLTQIVDSSAGTISRSYDDLDRLTQEVTPQGTVSYTYDAAGRRTSMTVQGQPTVSYTYDNANRLTSLTQAAGSSNGNVAQTVSFAYDAANRLTQRTLPNGTTASYSYDAASQLTAITYRKSDNTLIGDLTYAYDGSGHRTTIGGSLAQVNFPGSVSSTSYNANHHLTAWDSTSFTYDLNGNLTGDGVRSYSWNERDQLVGISGGVSASFSYDALGRRIGKTVAGTTTGYVYDGLNFVQEKDGTGSGASVTANLLIGELDQVYLRSSGGQLTSFMTDALGSTVALANPGESTVNSYSYEPYGATTPTGTSSNSQQYTGRENDGTGLYYYRARYYHPGLGRFVSEDPIGWASGQTNGYAYVGGDPLSFADPLGLLSSLPQGFVDAVTGFGDGAYSAITLGFGDLQDIRGLAGIDGGVNPCSGWYGAGNVAGELVGSTALTGAIFSQAGWGLKLDGPHKGMGPHLHYGPKYPGSNHPRWHFGPKNPSHGKGNFSWGNWVGGGMPWRWK